MKINQNLTNSLYDLNQSNLKKFGYITCIRVIPIYKEFETKIAIEGYPSISRDSTTGFEHLTKILSSTKPDQITADSSKIKKFLTLSSKLSPYDDDYPILEAYIAQYVANCIHHYLNFLLSDDIQSIIWCSDSLVEIINFIESERLEREDIESEELIDEKIKNELEIQLELIELIKLGVGLDLLIAFSDEHKVNWDL